MLKYSDIAENQTVYIIDSEKEKQTYKIEDLLEIYAKQVNTPYGLEKMIHRRGSDVWTWGEDGSQPECLAEFESKEIAQKTLIKARFIEYFHNEENPQVFVCEKELENHLSQLD